MRKLKLQMQISVDGYVAGPDGGLDWMVWDWDEALKDYVKAITAPVDHIVMGRVLAQGFIPHWAAAAADSAQNDVFTRKMHETPKLVFSKTLHTHDWPNATLAQGDLVKEIAQLKQQEGKDIIAYGGSTFVSNLIKHGLIDEYHLFVNPVMLGAGMGIFQALENRYPLKLAQARSFDCGIAVLNYVPA